MTISSPVNPLYISAGCNRCPKSLDWGGKQNQLIYAQSNSIALLSDCEPFEIKCTFNKHTQRVNAVKWIAFSECIQKNKLSTNEFVSVSKDKSVILWQGQNFEYQPCQILTGHTNNVSIVDAMYYDENNTNLVTYIASAAIDSTVRIWNRRSQNYDLKNSTFNQDQVIVSKMNGFALALKFFLLPTSNLPLLLIGFDNHKIELYVRLHNESENKDQFYCLHTLIGHEDWIRDIDVCQPRDNQLLIASSSQDNYIRLWKLESNVLENKEDISTKLIIEDDTVENQSDQSDRFNKDEDEDEEEMSKKLEKTEDELKLKSSLFTVHCKKMNNYIQYSINLESVLYGHEDWIYTVKFHPKMSFGQPLTLISASMDKTLVVWTYNEENSVWIDVARAGDIGGNTLGFYGATFDPSAKYIIAHGYQGALHLWKRNLEEPEKGEILTPAIINSGHFDFVQDICWEPGQNYFLTVSKDQTTRFHGCWSHDGTDTWHEIGRPQIHGYDLQCVSFIDRSKFVSGADEKVLRIFESPRIFLKNYFCLSHDQSIKEFLDAADSLPQGASVPALGLSNKAVYDDIKDDNEEKKPSLADELYKEVYFNRVELNKPPTEEHLLQNTLWPETQKLYGHGYELFSVAVDTERKIIASACKASKPEHAEIILWQQQNTNNQLSFKQYDKLKGHELTIVQMKFSNSGRYLLSVSRDRSWKLFERKTENNRFELCRGISSKNAYHTRIIWSCDWSDDDKYFVTASRDKRVFVWYGENASVDQCKPVGNNLDLTESITACAFAPSKCTDDNYLIALGFESGRIEFYKWSLEHGFKEFSAVEDRFSHNSTVKRLSFRKKFFTQDKFKEFHLASCSEDGSARLFTLKA